MNPKPLSRTSRLIVPVAIRVSLGTRCPRGRYQVPFQRSFLILAGIHRGVIQLIQIANRITSHVYNLRLFQRDSRPLPSGSRDTKDQEGEPLPRFLLPVLHVSGGGKPSAPVTVCATP